MTKSIGRFEILDHNSLFNFKSYLYSYDCLRFLSTSKALAHEVGVASEAQPGDDPPLYCKGWITRFSCFVASRIAVVLEITYDMGPRESFPKIDPHKAYPLIVLETRCIDFLMNAIATHNDVQPEKYKKAKTDFFKLYNHHRLRRNKVMDKFVKQLMSKAAIEFKAVQLAMMGEPPSPSFSFSE